MALVIEDGSIVAGAESYASAADLRAYASKRGQNLTTSKDADLEVFLVKAMARITAIANGRFQGDRTRPDLQTLDWPRYGARVDNWLIPSNQIPRNLTYAQLGFALAENNGTDILPIQDIQDPGRIVEETVGPITTIYANDGIVRRMPALAEPDALLRTLMVRSGLMAVRA